MDNGGVGNQPIAVNCDWYELKNVSLSVKLEHVMVITLLTLVILIVLGELVVHKVVVPALVIRQPPPVGDKGIEVLPNPKKELFVILLTNDWPPPQPQLELAKRFLVGK